MTELWPGIGRWIGVDKVYITAQALLEDSFRLAHLIYEDGFHPQFIIGIWRGGTPVGIAVQEYFELFHRFSHQ